MPDVLRNVDSAAPQALFRPQPQLDPVTERVVQSQLADAQAQAYQQGHRDGRAQALAEIDSAVNRITAALADVHGEIRAQRRAATTAALDIVDTIVRELLDDLPPPEVNVTFERITTAIELLLDEPITMHVSPSDDQVLGELLRARGYVVTGDATLDSGEAKIVGPNAGADLTRDALHAAIRETFAEGAS